jgi:predicted dinucleotide-binding enzyme
MPANPNGSMMFSCVNDKEATDKVVTLASEISFEAMNISDLAKSRLLEPLAV